MYGEGALGNVGLVCVRYQQISFGGGRKPACPSEQLDMLVAGIVGLAAKRDMTDITPESVMRSLTAGREQKFGTTAFCAKFDFMVRELNMNVAALAKALNYDASFLSRMRTGNRMPSDRQLFVRKLSDYIVKTYSEKEIGHILEQVFGEAANGEQEPLVSRLELFFLGTSGKLPDQAAHFLKKLDDFDLNEYIRSIHFDELKVPTAPFQLHTNRKYFGVEGQKEGEIDFLKGAVLARAQDPIFMCSEMDMTDMAEDIDFSKKWMLGIAMLLKRNLKLNVIHNLNRPFGELMLGLEAWIPLYMTGQVNPYYLKGANAGMYRHLLYTSGTYALSGECIRDAHERGRYVLTNSKEEVAYYRERAGCILQEACPLMDIYTEERKEEFQEFYASSLTIPGNKRFLSSSLPIFPLPEALLADFLEQSDMLAEERVQILETVMRNGATAEEMVSNNQLYQEVPLISEEEFRVHPVMLDFKVYGYDQPVAYSYEDYLRHMQACEEYAKTHENYCFVPNKEFAFRNITIRIVEGEWVWISKIKAPVIHFVIRHPILRDAIEHMCVPIYD